MVRKSRKKEASGRRRERSSAAGQPYARSAQSAARIKKLLEEQDVIARTLQLVHDIYGPDALLEAWDEFRGPDIANQVDILLEFTPHSPFLEQFTSWLTHTWTAAKLAEKPVGLTIPDTVPTQMFLAWHPDMDPLLVGYLRACIATPFSYFEVVQSQPGRKFTCRDLISGAQHLVVDGPVAALLRPRQIVYARIVEVDGVPVVDAAAPWALPEHMKPAVLALRERILEGPFVGVQDARIRQSLLAHEPYLRNFYWGFIEQALADDSLLPQVNYNYDLHKAAERLLAMLAPGKTAAEVLAGTDLRRADPQLQQEIVSKFTYFFESWVDDKLAFFGNKTAVEVVATPEGRAKVESLMKEFETVFSLLPFSLDPKVLRRVRERLGLSSPKDLN